MAERHLREEASQDQADKILIKQFSTKSEAETEDLGFRLGKMLKTGDVVALNGELGAGKTHFTSGVAKSIGISSHITSPTYTIVNEYTEGEVLLMHFDTYRLTCGDDLYDIGFDDYLARKGIIIIEWAENVDDALPENTIKVNIKRHDSEGENLRTVVIEFPEGDERNDSFGI